MNGKFGVIGPLIVVILAKRVVDLTLPYISIWLLLLSPNLVGA